MQYPSTYHRHRAILINDFGLRRDIAVHNSLHLFLHLDILWHQLFHLLVHNLQAKQVCEFSPCRTLNYYAQANARATKPKVRLHMAWRSLHLGLWRRRRRRRQLLEHDRLGLRDWYGLHHYWLLHHLDRLLHHLDRLPPNLGKEWSRESHAQTSNGFAKPCDKALLAILHVAGK